MAWRFAPTYNLKTYNLKLITHLICNRIDYIFLN